MITLTARHIAILAHMHGFEINDKDYSDEELDESEYTIIRCPEAGILDEETGEVFHTKYVAYSEATYGDGEAEPLTDPKL